MFAQHIPLSHKQDTDSSPIHLSANEQESDSREPKLRCGLHVVVIGEHEEAHEGGRVGALKKAHRWEARMPSEAPKESTLKAKTT
jgi:hypothetical protein